MQAVKRIELISDEVEMHKVLDSLDKIGIPDYTIIRNVLNKNSRGNASDDISITGLGGNVYVIFYCREDKVKDIVAEIRPILNKFGGACYISDAMEIRSVHCVASL
jgi:nitrogen regulatory protein PII